MNESENIITPEITPQYQRFTQQQTSIERGKLPPQNLNAEEVVLGAMLIDKRGVDNAIDMLSPDVFYKKQHQLIYQAIFELFNQSLPIDLITVSEQLRKDGNLEAAGGRTLSYQPHSARVVVCQCGVPLPIDFADVYQTPIDRTFV